MSNNYKTKFDLNKFFKNIKLKKQYLNNLNNKFTLLFNVRETNYKQVDHLIFPFFSNKTFFNYANLVTHVIDINFSRSNTFVHVMDFSGKLKFSYSAGSFQYSGKTKKSRFAVFKDIYRVLVSKLTFLKGKPIALHLKNVGHNKIWIIKRLKKKFFIKSIKNFDFYPHNGCRKRKVRRKKFKKK